MDKLDKRLSQRKSEYASRNESDNTDSPYESKFSPQSRDQHRLESSPSFSGSQHSPAVKILASPAKLTMKKSGDDLLTGSNRALFNATGSFGSTRSMAINRTPLTDSAMKSANGLLTETLLRSQAVNGAHLTKQIVLNSLQNAPTKPLVKSNSSISLQASLPTKQLIVNNAETASAALDKCQEIKRSISVKGVPPPPPPTSNRVYAILI